ncbi:hypothetical protein E4U55_007324 [Claviceps digitariae]|nr:hypothetical protein E4U55_007324 [Claviceps digitariae]
MQLVNSAVLAVLAIFAGQTLALDQCVSVGYNGYQLTKYDCIPENPDATDSWYCPFSKSRITRMPDGYVYALDGGDSMSLEITCEGSSYKETLACVAGAWKAFTVDCPNDAVVFRNVI